MPHDHEGGVQPPAPTPLPDPAQADTRLENHAAVSKTTAGGPAPTSPWTPHAAWTVLGLVGMSFAFIVVLAMEVGVDPKVAVPLTILLVSCIVMCIAPSKQGGSVGRRVCRALLAYYNDGPPDQP